MKIYPAAGYAARDAVRTQVVPLLEAAGHRVEATWLTEQHEVAADTVGTSPAQSEDYAFHHASNDIAEVQDADVLLLITDQWARDNLDFDASLLRPSGGRHVETGVALGDGKYVVVLGDYENIFQRGLCLQAWDVKGALEALRMAGVAPW